ncbi:hypothetical protein P167DRAFT_538969 [Morchella conica CCBAS932]|uniref:Uncharacterized protein n=1 Tax=Morchella conica CCBAS932 TaxID=1392247 RepID=A0A3N4KHA0_9PEZI|nr:hypothetical protein P167DRAFT_538969 [Morchella conica CCBAS932]
MFFAATNAHSLHFPRNCANGSLRSYASLLHATPCWRSPMENMTSPMYAIVTASAHGSLTTSAAFESAGSTGGSTLLLAANTLVKISSASGSLSQRA